VTKTFVRLVSKQSRSVQSGVRQGAGTIDVFHLDQEIQKSQDSSACSLPSGGAELPWPSRAVPKLIQLPHLTSVLISADSGLGIYAWLRSVSRGGIMALSSFSVPVRRPLEITIAGCLPVKGEAVYARRRSTVHQIGIAFSSWRNPNVPIGTAAAVHALDAPFTSGRGSILDIASSTISILCKAAISPGAWVRIEARRWILFGVVKDLVPISMMGRCLEIHLEAAFHANQADRRRVADVPADSIVAEPLVPAGHETDPEDTD
jgi:hypothetical protein